LIFVGNNRAIYLTPNKDELILQNYEVSDVLI